MPIREQFPFFIVGCGRSGTSLLRSLLNRHPEIAIPLESLFIVDYLRTERRFDELIALLAQEPEIREWGLAIGPEDFAGVESAVEAIERLHERYAAAQGKPRWGQKTPRFVRHLPLLAGSFPRARFVHLVRDPRAVASSLIRSDVHHSNAYYAALRWAKDVSAGLAFEREAPGRVLRVRYEQLVAQTSKVLAQVASFLDIASIDGWWKDAGGGIDEYSAFYEQIHANLDQPVSDEFVDRWRDDLSSWQLETVEALTGDLMDKLGYGRELERAHLGPAATLYFRLDRLAGLARQLSKYLRQRRVYLVFLLRRKWKLGLLKEFLWTANY